MASQLCAAASVVVVPWGLPRNGPGWRSRWWDLLPHWSGISPGGALIRGPLTGSICSTVPPGPGQRPYRAPHRAGSSHRRRDSRARRPARARFPLPPAVVTPSEIGAALAELGVSKLECDAVIEFFRITDAALFAPTSDNEALLNSASALVTRLQAVPTPLSLYLLCSTITPSGFVLPPIPDDQLVRWCSMSSTGRKFHTRRREGLRKVSCRPDVRRVMASRPPRPEPRPQPGQCPATGRRSARRHRAL